MNKKHFDIEKHEDEVLEDFEKGEFFLSKTPRKKNG